MHEKENGPPMIRFGPFTLDGRSGELRNGPTRLKVPDQSIAVLQALLERPGELVTREALRDRLWGPDTFVDFEAGLNAAVRRLREALNDSADAPRYIETLPRRGYRFIAPVEGALATPVPTAPGSAAGEVPIAAQPETARTGRVRARHVALATLALALIGAGLWAGLRWSNPTSTAAGRVRAVPITSFPGLELDPAISPTGTLVAFAWEGEGGDNFDIYVRSIDGSSQLRLTTDAAADHLPAWSPDGQRIAFVRVQNGRRVIKVMPALGGPERRLYDAGPERAGWFMEVLSYGLSWTPDGTHLVFGEQHVGASTSAISLYSLDDEQTRQLTRPPANFGDINPVVSPDGRYLAFIRRNTAYCCGSVFVQKLDRLRPLGEPVQLTFEHTVLGLDWAPDSGSVIYDSDPVAPGLWRIAVGGAGTPDAVLPHVRALRPSVARVGGRVVFQNTFVDSNIWELPTPSSPNRASSGDATFRLISSTFNDQDPQLSPDGKRIAFVSFRAGNRDLYVSNRDGSEPRQLTDVQLGYAGSPAWSADGVWIAFDGIRTGGWNLHVVAADGGPIRVLTSDAFNNIRPSWSADGRWIYFGSDRPGEYQIWKIPSAGGTAIQVTRRGGKHPVVSPDGRHVYYAKEAPVQGIWEVPAEGGPEVQIVDHGREMTFDVANNGIYIMDVSGRRQATVEVFSFSSRQLAQVARLPAGLRFGGNSNLAVSRDGRSMLYVQFDQWLSDIEMVNGFR